jgi:tryptophan 2,3-dioxygenase
MSRKPTTYWDYLKLDTLLGLQNGLEGDDASMSNDEVMFIVIHQIDELWMKLALRELVSVRDLFAQDSVPETSMAAAVRGLQRATTLFGQLSSHFALMETMTTRDYLSFRDKLSPASGFQSAQMREIEIVMGLDMSERIPLGAETYLQALRNKDGSETAASRRVAARLEDTPTMLAAISEWLWRTPIDGSSPGDEGDDEAVVAFIEAYLRGHASEADAAQALAMEHALTEEDQARLRSRYDREKASARAYLMAEEVEADQARVRRVRAAAIFVESYRELPLLAWPRELLDAIVALEQAFVIFRQRHARMVERVIGRRTGTGGSAGVDYLDNTALRYRVFKDIWAARTLLLRREALPELANAAAYDFADPALPAKS